MFIKLIKTMSILLTNACIIDPFGETEYIENGYILIEDETIVKIGAGSALNIVADTTIDLQGKIILPGMINAHTHLYSALAIGMPAPKNTPTNFIEILKGIWWKLDLALDEDSTKASFEAGLLECLQSGVTTVFDHHSSPNFTIGSLELLVNINSMYFMFQALILALAVYGAYLMWKLKKIGFHLYAISQIILLILPQVFLPSLPFPTFELIISLIFVTLYAKNLYTMS